MEQNDAEFGRTRSKRILFGDELNLFYAVDSVEMTTVDLSLGPWLATNSLRPPASAAAHLAPPANGRRGGDVDNHGHRRRGRGAAARQRDRGADGHRAPGPSHHHPHICHHLPAACLPPDDGRRLPATAGHQCWRGEHDALRLPHAPGGAGGADSRAPLVQPSVQPQLATRTSCSAHAHQCSSAPPQCSSSTSAQCKQQCTAQQQPTAALGRPQAIEAMHGQFYNINELLDAAGASIVRLPPRPPPRCHFPPPLRQPLSLGRRTLAPTPRVPVSGLHCPRRSGRSTRLERTRTCRRSAVHCPSWALPANHCSCMPLFIVRRSSLRLNRLAGGGVRRCRDRYGSHGRRRPHDGAPGATGSAPVSGHAPPGHFWLGFWLNLRVERWAGTRPVSRGSWWCSGPIRSTMISHGAWPAAGSSSLAGRMAAPSRQSRRHARPNTHTPDHRSTAQTKPNGSAECLGGRGALGTRGFDCARPDCRAALRRREGRTRNNRAGQRHTRFALTARAAIAAAAGPSHWCSEVLAGFLVAALTVLSHDGPAPAVLGIGSHVSANPHLAHTLCGMCVYCRPSWQQWRPNTPSRCCATRPVRSRPKRGSPSTWTKG